MRRMATTREDCARKGGWGLALLTLLLAALLLMMGRHGFPLPGDDSSCFIPPAVHLKNGEGLINPVDIHTHLTDPTGGDRFMYYPPLLQFTLAGLMPQGNAMGVLFALSLIGTMALIATSFLLWRRLKTSETPGILGTLVTGLSLMGILSYLPAGTNGRPEVLVMLWVALWASILLFGKFGKPWVKDVLVILLLGLNAATQPVSAFLGGLLIALYYLLTKAPKPVLIRIAALAAGGGALLLLVLALSPYGIERHIHAILTHASHVVINHEPFNPAQFVQMYFTGAHFTGYGLVLATALIALSLHIRRANVSKTSRILCWLVFAVLLASLWYFAIRISARNYNVFALMPVILLGNLDLLLSLPALLKNQALKTARAGLVLITAVTTIGFVRKALLFYFFLHQGVSLEQARQDFARIAPQAHGMIYVSDSLWTLTEDHRRLRYWYDKAGPLPPGTGMLIVQNNIFRNPDPPVIPGYKIIFSSFNHQVPKVLGKAISGQMPGYNFAAYVPAGNAVAK